MIILSENNYLPKENQIKLTSDIDNTIPNMIKDLKENSFGIISQPEIDYNGTGQAKIITEEINTPKSLPSILFPEMSTMLNKVFKMNKDSTPIFIDNTSIKYKYIANKKAQATFNTLGTYLEKFSPLFDQTFAKKNTRLKANELIIKNEENTELTKAYPFILGVGAGVNTINLQMVVRSFIIPMERVDLNTNLSVFKYPEWFMNKKAIIDAVEDTIYISGNASSIVFYGSKTNEFGYNPADYDLKLSNYNIINFYNRHNKLVATNNSGSTNS